MSSTACWPWPSPTCCAARPTTPACTCRSASCWPSWPASRKPCCSTTTAAKAAPGLGACSPTWTPPNSAWPTCSTFTATHRPADHAHTGELGNTPTPPAHTVLPAETPSTINEGRKLTLGRARRPKGQPDRQRSGWRTLNDHGPSGAQLSRGRRRRSTLPRQLQGPPTIAPDQRMRERSGSTARVVLSVLAVLVLLVVATGSR